MKTNTISVISVRIRSVFIPGGERSWRRKREKKRRARRGEREELERKDKRESSRSRSLRDKPEPSDTAEPEPRLLLSLQ
jgi:hypothetical protein